MSVLIVGAGISGLVCGYQLDHMTSGLTDLKILEARSEYGGRIQKLKTSDDNFFNIDFGAQDMFLTSEPRELEDLLTEEDKAKFMSEEWETEVRPVPDYSRESNISYTFCPDGFKKASQCDSNADFYRDSLLNNSSFKTNSLANFVKDFFYEPIKDKVMTNTAVKHIDYSDPTKIIVTTKDGIKLETNKLVIAVPVKMLQKESTDVDAITFNPELTKYPEYTNAINTTETLDGKRIFVEFSSKFYDDVTKVGGVVYWDAARGRSNTNVVTIQGNRCTEPNAGTCDMSEQRLRRKLKNDLDRVYGWKEQNITVTNVYFKDWTNERYIEMSNRGGNPDYKVFEDSIDNRIWFVGEYTRERKSNLAGKSGVDVAKKIAEKIFYNDTWRTYLNSGGRVTNPDKTCTWVAQNPEKRCKRNGSVLVYGVEKENIKAGDACTVCSNFLR